MVTSERSVTGSLEYIFDKGKYYVIELSSMCSDNKLIKLDKQAIRLHLKLRYMIGRQQKLNPRMKIGFISYDVCFETSLLMETLANFILDDKFRGSTYSTNIIAVVSFMPFHMTRLAADVMTTTSIPYYAYANQSESYSFVDNHKKYHSSYQLLHKDIDEIEREVLFYNFKHVALVTIGKSGLASIHRDVLWRSLVKHHGLCVLMKDLTGKDTTEMEEFVSEVRRDKTLRMVVIWSKRIYRGPFLQFTDGIYNRVWYWYSENTFRNNLDYNIDPLTLESHIFITHPAYGYQQLNVVFNYGVMKSKINSFNYKQILNDHWISRFITENNLTKTNPDIFEMFDRDKNIIDEHIESLITPLWWSQPFRVLQKGSMSKLWAKLNRLLRVYRKKYKIVYSNVKNRPTNRIKLVGGIANTNRYFESIRRFNIFNCNRRKCAPGFESIKKIFLNNDKNTVFDWDCVRCKENYIKSYFGNHTCNVCEGRWISNANKSECYDPYTKVYLKFFDKKSLLLLLPSIISAIFNMLAIYMFMSKANTPIIRSSGLVTSLAQLITHLLLSFTTVFLFVGTPTSTTCICQLFVPGYLLTFLLSLFLSKTQKLIFVFQAKVRLTSFDLQMSRVVEVFISVVLLLIESVFCILRLVTHSTQTEENLNIEDRTIKIYCRHGHSFHFQFVYILCLALFCSIQAFRARHLPKLYRETKQMTYSMFITVLIIIFYFPLAYSLDNYHVIFVNAFIVMLINITNLCISFIPSVTTIVFRPERNTKEYIRAIMLDDAQKRTAKAIRRHNRKSNITNSTEIQNQLAQIYTDGERTLNITKSESEIQGKIDDACNQSTYM